MEVSLQEWDTFLETIPSPHLLQTGEWGELKSLFGWKPVRIQVGAIGAQILLRRLPLGLTIAYIPKGPVASPRATTNAGKFWIEVDRICRERRAIMLKLEPDGWEGEGIDILPPDYSFRPSPHPVQPARTILIDLEVNEGEILSRMKQKTRYNIRLAEKKGVLVRPWTDLTGFHRMIETTGNRDTFGVHTLEYYRKVYDIFHPKGMVEMFVAEYEGHPLAALMVFARGERSWYMYGASSDEQRNRMPAYLLQWAAIRWAKDRGCLTYDMWGVPDFNEENLEADFESRNDGLWGVYRFKRGFGGKVIRAAQPRDHVYNSLLYRLYLLRMAGREAS
ncbi:MAG: peptidoglycan bridge formation glycyltransferase FemA/FemB family protein [Chloroflexota bacterium]